LKVNIFYYRLQTNQQQAAVVGISLQADLQSHCTAVQGAGVCGVVAAGIPTAE
jgi:hypothetical protein